jgi:ATP-binding cassette subfamily B protein
MSLGEFMAFYNYVNLMVFPIVILGFVSNIIIRAAASFGRIQVVLNSHVAREGTYVPKEFKGEIEFRDVSLVIKGKTVLSKINFVLRPGQKTALIGPTGAGKTLIIYLIAGLIDATEGKILIDGQEVSKYDLDYLRSKIALVFQDNVMFNTTIRENIVFKTECRDEDLEKIVFTAALDGFVKEQKMGLEALISERGASLSGGQKQRISLARALALRPELLLLDDFTARVDLKTEKAIFDRMERNYPGLATISVSQKIESVKDYDHLILLMEGELLDQGSHQELMERSFEYKQIYSSQKSTDNE